MQSHFIHPRIISCWLEHFIFYNCCMNSPINVSWVNSTLFINPLLPERVMMTLLRAGISLHNGTCPRATTTTILFQKVTVIRYLTVLYINHAYLAWLNFDLHCIEIFNNAFTHTHQTGKQVTLHACLLYVIHC